jgi:hypothetical protein
MAMVVGTVHSTKQICSKQPGHAVHLKLEEHVVKNKILYAPRRHRMITPIERYPSLGVKPSSWIHRSPGVIIVVTPLVHK